MGDSLSPCPSCFRHVRATATACAFCASPLPEGFGASLAPEGRVKGPLTRAALLFMGASAAAGCSEAVAVYGPGPVQDASAVDGASDAATPDAATPDAARDDSGGPVALYGPAPQRDGG